MRAIMAHAQVLVAAAAAARSVERDAAPSTALMMVSVCAPHLVPCGPQRAFKRHISACACKCDKADTSGETSGRCAAICVVSHLERRCQQGRRLVVALLKSLPQRVSLANFVNVVPNQVDVCTFSAATFSVVIALTFCTFSVAIDCSASPAALPVASPAAVGLQPS